MIVCVQVSSAGMLKMHVFYFEIEGSHPSEGVG